MKIDSAALYALHIPFRLEFTHSRKRRVASDSYVVAVTSGATTGYGEAVVRDYVSGNVGDGDPLENVAGIVSKFLEYFASHEPSIATIREWHRELEVEHHELPVLCAVETALLDLLCSDQNIDIYQLIGAVPVRTHLSYGGTLPMLPMGAAERLLERYRIIDIPYLRVKIGENPEYNRMLLKATREAMGDDYDLRVDANAAWDLDSIFMHLELLSEFGISIVEEPFGRDGDQINRCLEDGRSQGFTFVADESGLTETDVETMAKSGTYSMINIRLSKNGGLLRSLALAERADSLGLRYQLGCLVGETGILSAAGRVAASLMADPVYVDGSYDRYLLSENITEEDLTFGQGGAAEVVRGNGLGYCIDEEKLNRLCNGRLDCI